MSEKVLFEMRYDEAQKGYTVTESAEWRAYHRRGKFFFRAVRFKHERRKAAVEHALESLQQMYDDLYAPVS